MKTKWLASISMGLLLATTSGWAEQETLKQPSSSQIIQWLSNLDESNANPKQAIDIERTEEIRLDSGEQAYLSAVYFKSSARNYALGYILTRPTLKESRILNEGGQSNDFNIEYVHLPKKEHAVALIALESAGSGQGYISRSKSMNYIKDWQVKKLHEVEFGSNSGARVDCKDSYDNLAYLNIVDQYILETTVEANGCSDKKPKEYKVRSRFVAIQIP